MFSNIKISKSYFLFYWVISINKGSLNYPNAPLPMPMVIRN